jgi:hypothetical protein
VRRYLLLLAFLVLLLLIGACAPPPNPTPTAPPTRTLAPLPRSTVTPTPSLSPSDVNDTPIPSLTPTLIAPTSIPPTLAPTYTFGDIPSMERRLYDTPIFGNIATDRARQIFAAGQGMGNRADVFTTIGDSNTTNGDFLQPIGMGADAYCDWGAYADLAASVGYFSVPPTADNAAANSFTHHSQAARKGFNSAAVLDSFWASEDVCRRGESSLMCEFRLVQPSVAIVMLGGIDINDMDTPQYTANMRAIVQTTIQQGVIPVVTTFVVLPERGALYERSLEFNMALLDIAAAEGTPLLNLWAAAQSLPDHGIGPDRTHLKAVVGSFCSFDGAQTLYGGTLRNLLTLQVLDALRRDVLTQ